MRDHLRLQGKACSKALFGNTSGLNCTDVDWTECDPAHKLPGVVPLTVELYRQGKANYSRATCVPAYEFRNFGKESGEKLNLQLKQTGLLQRRL